MRTSVIIAVIDPVTKTTTKTKIKTLGDFVRLLCNSIIIIHPRSLKRRVKDPLHKYLRVRHVFNAYSTTLLGR